MTAAGIAVLEICRIHQRLDPAEARRYEETIERVRNQVLELCARFPVYG